jgi:hypothetical protein
LNGTIGVEAALLLARVMTPETESAWVDRAKERTFKHLREEIDLVELAARINDDRSPSLPPDRDEIRAFEAMESAILSGDLMRHALGIARDDDVAGPAAFEVTAEGNVQMSGASSPAGAVQMSGVPIPRRHPARSCAADRSMPFGCVSARTSGCGSARSKLRSQSTRARARSSFASCACRSGEPGPR